MSIAHWLAFDLGTTGVKAALVDRGGHILRSAIVDYPTHAAEGGVMEQHAADWWRALVAACREIDASAEAEAIALTGQMQDAILLDAAGDPVRPVILYSDTRARAEAETVLAQLGLDRLRELTGNDQDAGGLLAKLLWLARNEPNSLSRATRLLLGAAEYAAFKLTGRAVTDTTTASTTGLLDLTRRTMLDASIFDSLGIEAAYSLLPEVVAGGAQIGVLSDESTSTLGLKPGLPVHLGPGDAGAATLGAGSGEPGVAYLYLGTSGWVAFTAEEPASPERGVLTIAHPDPDRCIPVAPLLTAGGNLEWIRDLFGQTDYTTLIEAAVARPGIPPLYLPYLNGERSPIRDPLARGAFVGLSAATTRADLDRAVLEGVAFAYRHALACR
jgi:xylulokinase